MTIANDKWKKKNKEKVKLHSHTWYVKNKKLIIARINLRRINLRKWFDEYKSALKCIRCSESHPATLHFHHVDPTQKEGNIAKVVNHNWSKKKILSEVAKCIVLCANCHAKEHYIEKNLEIHKT